MDLSSAWISHGSLEARNGGTKEELNFLPERQQIILTWTMACILRCICQPIQHFLFQYRMSFLRDYISPALVQASPD